MERSNGHAVAVWFNGSRLVCLPNKMPEVCKSGGRGKQGERCIFDLVSTWKQARSCRVINHSTVFYKWAILCGVARCTVHSIPLESNLLGQLHSAGVVCVCDYFFSIYSVSAAVYCTVVEDLLIEQRDKRSQGSCQCTLHAAYMTFFWEIKSLKQTKGSSSAASPHLLPCSPPLFTNLR